jgi:hypothetical protein
MTKQYIHTLINGVKSKLIDCIKQSLYYIEK